mmetsp:Transcript_6929/g.12914  ORF Transcript_6929/g.12914 Transcript_6929/m.12914 type:complete len:208 (+) Transcript_6929:441-1064(+)
MPYMCRYCNRSFRQENTKNEHEYRIHSNPSTVHTCPKCSKMFRFKKAWSEHLDAEHGKLLCMYCNDTFAKERSRARHCERAHPHSKPYTCTVCKGFRCKTWKEFKMHRDVHRRERPRPFQCRFCDRTFPTMQSQLIHNRTHVQEKPFLCEICQRPFGDASNLRRHLDVHARQMFRCVSCGLESQDYLSLLLHTRDSHPDYRRVCVAG